MTAMGLNIHCCFVAAPENIFSTKNISGTVFRNMVPEYHITFNIKD